MQLKGVDRKMGSSRSEEAVVGTLLGAGPTALGRWCPTKRINIRGTGWNHVWAMPGVVMRKWDPATPMAAFTSAD